MNANTKRVGLYIHIPFCLHKCAYCDFCSAEQKEKMQKEAYIDALMSDIENTGKEVEDDGIIIDTIYVGGGTPTLLSKKEIELLTDMIYDSFKVTADAEFTFEANPATLDRTKARTLLECGVNRLSIGLQSVHQNELEALSRIHNFKDFLQSYKTARKAGFENVNIDVMYGIPEQTVESFLETLRVVCELSPEHVSMYGLRIEEGTPFYVHQSELDLPNEDEEYTMYRKGRELLSSYGYSQYEISNYAKAGYESKHNMRYWKCKEYLGLGVAAHSFYADKRYAKITDVDRYISYICAEDNYKQTIIASSEQTITKNDLEVEFVMLGLRTSAGVIKEEYKAMFGEDFDRKYAPRIKAYVDAGFMINTPHSCSLSPEGMYVSNKILSEILDL